MTLDFVAVAAAVRVPATCANIGPGFDSLGLAISRYDDVSARVARSGVQISVSGAGASSVPLDESHLVVRAMRAAFDRLGGQPAGLTLECVNRIPHGRGLGSSAAAIVAGVELARGLVVGGRELLDDDAALSLASEIEGHPDNVAACLLGGLTVAWTTGGVAHATRVQPGGFRPVIFIPTTESATQVARAALPATVAHSDAAFNVSRAALLVIALTGRPELLLAATQDRLHQAYRAASMPDTTDLVAALRSAGIASVVSGAGSSVLSLACSDDQVALALANAPDGWDCSEVAVADGAACRYVDTRR